MNLWLLILLTVFAHTAFSGSRIAVSLYAIHLNASPFTIGTLLSLYSLLPMLLAVSAGKLIDRVGVTAPLLIAALFLLLGIALPGLWPRMMALYLASALIGTSFMLFHVAVQSAVGQMGDAEQGPVNFSWLSLGFSVSAFLGPLLTGFTIDFAGYRQSFLLLAILPIAPLVVIGLRKIKLPGPHLHEDDVSARRALDLLREPRLQPIFIVTGLLSMGWDLFTFIMPIYGSRLGLSASTIGMVMAAFSIATFLVRLAMPWLVQRLSEWQLITAAMWIGGSAYALFPLVSAAPGLAAISFLLGLGLGSTQPSVMALIHNTTPRGRTGEAMGVRATVLNTSHTFLPLLFGGVGTALGIGPIFWSMAACFAAGGYFARRRLRSLI